MLMRQAPDAGLAACGRAGNSGAGGPACRGPCRPRLRFQASRGGCCPNAPAAACRAGPVCGRSAALLVPAAACRADSGRGRPAAVPVPAAARVAVWPRAGAPPWAQAEGEGRRKREREASHVFQTCRRICRIGNQQVPRMRQDHSDDGRRDAEELPVLQVRLHAVSGRHQAPASNGSRCARRTCSPRRSRRPCGSRCACGPCCPRGPRRPQAADRLTRSHAGAEAE